MADPKITLDQAIQLHQAGRVQEALALYAALLPQQGDNLQLLYMLGLARQQLGQADQAVAVYDRLLARNANIAEAHNNRGAALSQLERLDEALAAFDKALALKPDYAAAYNNRGAALLAMKRLDEALAAFERTLALNPGHAGAHNNRGATLKELMRLDEALAAYERAAELNPDYAEAHWNKAMLLILTGRYREGWALHEWRLKQQGNAQYQRFTQAPWRGEKDVRGKRILIHTEQGLGDVIQFCRYLPRLHALGAHIILEAPKALVPLLATLECPMQIVARGEILPDFDACCPIMSLPHAFDTTLETVPADTPYLFADANKTKAWQQRLGEDGRPRIGLVWAGSATHKNDVHRSIRLEELAPILDLPFAWHSLQKEYRPHDRELLSRHPGIRQHHDELHDFADTAALIDNLDLVITVDTSVAHAAGSMGKPVWVLLPFAPDYRWLVDRTDSPWYPTAKLFRQPVIGDWASVVADLRAALEALGEPA